MGQKRSQTKFVIFLSVIQIALVIIFSLMVRYEDSAEGNKQTQESKDKWKNMESQFPREM